MPKLAALISREGLNEPMTMRVLNANYRLGTPEAAVALASYANRTSGIESYRIEALRMLGEWEKVPGRDRVTGNWHPLPPRDPRIAKDAAAPVLPKVLRNAPDAVRVMAAGLLTKMGVGEPALLAELSADHKLGGELRSAAVGVLAETGDPRLAATVDMAMKDPDELVRAAGVRALGKLPDGVTRLGKVLDTGSPREQQAALVTLAALPGDDADRLIMGCLDRMIAGDRAAKPLAKEVRLDVLEAAGARKSPGVATKLELYSNSLDQSDPLAAYRDTLFGGNVKAGEKIFRERTDVQCIRCHSIKRKGGNAGPDLAGIGKRQQRTYLLESIVLPTKAIAPGFESVAVRMKDGTTYSGVLKKEDEDSIQVDNPGKATVTLDKSQIKSRRGGMSSMPDNLVQTLSKQDVRNLVEFLAGLTEDPPPPRNPATTREGRKREGHEVGS
jgi:quinoprotein glucose dehydrogenase